MSRGPVAGGKLLLRMAQCAAPLCISFPCPITMASGMQLKEAEQLVAVRVPVARGPLEIRDGTLGEVGADPQTPRGVGDRQQWEPTFTVAPF